MSVEKLIIIALGQICQLCLRVGMTFKIPTHQHKSYYCIIPVVTSNRQGGGGKQTEITIKNEIFEKSEMVHINYICMNSEQMNRPYPYCKILR